MKAIIAAGGSGTRLRPLTFSSNKHLLPVANKPLILYPLEAIIKVGVKEIGVVVNQTRPAVEAVLGDGRQWGVTITYIEQESPLGLAHVVKISEDFLAGQPFVYHLGDNIFTQGIKKPFEHFERTKPDGLLTIVEHPENFRLGVPFFDDSGKLVKVVEKPEKPPNKYGVPGLYFLNHHVFEAFSGQAAIQPSARGELEITDLYTYLLDHKFRVETEEVEGRWMDPGKFIDMLDANREMLGVKTDPDVQGMVETTSTVQGLLELGKGSRLMDSQVIGPVSIGTGCRIEHCHIGPNVSVADNCTMKGITITNSVVMQETTLLDVNRQIVDSFIGKQTEIWEEKQDSVSLFIGDHCKVRLT